jgi:ankyrin repeat protein
MLSALILAANNGHLNAVKVMLENFADIEARSNDGRTPLIWASHWGHVDIVLYLIERGAQIDATDLSKLSSNVMYPALNF